MKVPVILPVVRVGIDGQGVLAVDLDGEPFAIDRQLHRDDLRHVLATIAAQRQTAIRVEIAEADGATYVDILTPPEDIASGAIAEPLPVEPSLSDIRGAGFRPGENVAVAYVLMHHVADEDGDVDVRLPPAILTRHRAGLVLVGLDSRVITSLDAAAGSTA